MMWCVAPANCSAATASWTESTYSCTAPLTAKNHNTTVTLTDNTGTDTGVATYKCWDGTWTKQKGGCGPACPAETKNWTVGSNACSASIATGIPGQTKTANDTTLNPNRGKATYLYSAGTWVEQPGATCAPCSPVDGGWSSGCGYTRTCDNPAPYCGGRYCTGSAYISCPSFSECGCKETCTSTYDLWCGPNSGNYACGKQIFNACYSCTTVCSSGSPRMFLVCGLRELLRQLLRNMVS